MGKHTECTSRTQIANSFRFGAVLEEFEVRDALMKMFYTRPDLGFSQPRVVQPELNNGFF
jgi:hypothetical protein